MSRLFSPFFFVAFSFGLVLVMPLVTPRVQAQSIEEPKQVAPQPEAPKPQPEAQPETPEPAAEHTPTQSNPPRQAQPQPRPRPKPIRREEVERLKSEIQRSEQVLSQVRQRASRGQEAAQAYEQQIGLRTQLVEKFKGQIWTYAAQKDSINQSIEQLRLDLIQVRRSSQRHALHLYKYGRMHDLILLFSSRSINEFLIRAFYLRIFSKQRTRQALNIKTAEMELQARQKAINGIIQHNEGLLQEAQNQQNQIESLKKEQQKSLSSLQDREYRMESDLYRKRRYAEGLEVQMESVAPSIAYQAPNVQNQPAPSSSLSSLSLKDVLQVARTSANRIFSSGQGIEVEVAAGAGVKAGYSGSISKIFVVPNLGNCIALQHGEYTSVYGNLSAIAVRQGQNVNKGDLLGNSGTNEDPLGARLFLAVYRDQQPLNPLVWLK